MRTLPLVLVLAVLAGCDSDPIIGGEVLSRGQVEAARADFADLGPDDYTLRYAIDCFCPPNEVTVRVVDGAVAGVETTTYDVEGLTVLGLYDVVLDAFRQDAARVSATVTDSRPRVPIQISIDYDEGIADEEIGYRVLSYRAD